MPWCLQLSERATEASDETACIINKLLNMFGYSGGLTYGGDTSGITQKGIGPRPTAKNLRESFQ